MRKRQKNKLVDRCAVDFYAAAAVVVPLRYMGLKEAMKRKVRRELRHRKREMERKVHQFWKSWSKDDDKA